MTEETVPNPDLENIADYLAEQGFRPKMVETGIEVKYQGRRYFIEHDLEDTEFYRVLAPNFWSIETEQERLLTPLAASEVSKTVKAAKVFIMDNNAWAAVELFVPDADAFTKVVDRSLSALFAAVDFFRQKYQEIEEEAESSEEHTGEEEKKPD